MTDNYIQRYSKLLKNVFSNMAILRESERDLHLSLCTNNEAEFSYFT